MDQCTHEVRAEYWRNIIKACGQRPAGQSAKKWIDENGICEQMIIPGPFEPPVRTLRATIPENESHIFR